MEKEIRVDCGCIGSCSSLKFILDEYDGIDELTIIHYITSFSSNSYPIQKSLKIRLQMIWWAITGKEFNLYDLLLSGDDVKKFKEDMREFIAD